MSKVRRKPAPAFPYSPRYPHPDPNDPFVPLQVLRERASSSSALNLYDNSSSGHLPSEHGDAIFRSVSPDVVNAEYTMVYPPSSSDHHRAMSPSPRPWQESSSGYHSDSPMARMTRQLRARVKPFRDSKAYVSEAELHPAPSYYRHQEQTIRPRDRQPEIQYHYRRRSQSVFTPRPLSEIPSEVLDEPPAAESPPTNASTDAISTLCPETPQADSDLALSPQYMYDDRQSHGYLYGADLGSETDVHASPTIEGHAEPKSQGASVRSPTPPMTPDDSLSLSSRTSTSARARSISPRSRFRDLPRVASRPTLRSMGSYGDERKDSAPETPAPIQSAEFSILQTPSRPTSPSPVPDVPAALPLIPNPPPVESEPEPEPEPETRRGRSQTAGKRANTVYERIRKTSSVGNGRRRMSNPGHRPLDRKRSSSDSESSMKAAFAELKSQACEAVAEPQESTRPPISEPQSTSRPPVVEHERAHSHPNTHTSGPVTISNGPSSFHDPQSHSHAGAPASRPPQGQSHNTDEGSKSDSGHGSRSTRYIQHQPKKSLSHVSLGLVTLPNVSLAPTAPSVNTSIGSAMTVGAGFGGLSREELERHTEEFALLRAPARQQAQPEPELAIPALASREEQERPKLAERNVRHLSGFPVFDGDSERNFDQPAIQNVPQAESTPASQVAAASNRPSVAVTAPPREEELDRHYTRRGPSPPPNRTLVNPLPPIPAPIPARDPSPEPRRQVTKFSALPPRPDSPEFYIAPIPTLPPTVTEIRAPAPLPLSPPQTSEPPTPLPQPTPRGKSPIPRPSSRNREAPAVVPSVVRSAPVSDAPVPARTRTPPIDSRQKKRDTTRQDERESGYFPVAQLPPHVPTELRTSVPEPRSQNSAPTKRRVNTAQISGPVRQPTPPSQVQQQGRTIPIRQPTPPNQMQPYTRSIPTRAVTPPNQVQQYRLAPARQPTPPNQQTQQPVRSGLTRQPTPPRAQLHHHNGRRSVSPAYRSQTPPVESQRRITPPSSHRQSRAQSPPVIPEFRAQSPPPTIPRAQSRSAAPAYHAPVRAKSPTRALSPSSSKGHSRSRLRNQTQEQGYALAVRPGTAPSDDTQESNPPNRHHGTAPATPVMHPSTPSPAMTTHSQLYQPSRPGRRARSYAVTNASSGARLTEQPEYRYQGSRPLPFDEYAIPTREQLQRASSLYVIARNGIRVPFGQLFKDRRTVVVFIRHFWCAADQDYMYSIARGVDADALKRAGVDLVVIGLGSSAMIKSYRQIFRTPFELYTDPSLQLHMALGMTRRSSDPGSDIERGEYVRHGSIGGLAMVVKNAIRVGMPVWEKGGDVSQLGGEFVLGPGTTCAYVHRMRTTRSHAPILHILAAAGVSTSGNSDMLSRAFYATEDDDQWEEDRRKSYMRMQARRSEKQREGFGVASLGYDLQRERSEPSWGRNRDHRNDDGDRSYESVEPGSDRGAGSMSGCWGSDMTPGEMSIRVGLTSEHDDGRIHGRKGTRSEKGAPARRFKVTNPEEHQYMPPTPIEDGRRSRAGYGDSPNPWDADVSDLPYLEGIARDRQEAYRLTQQVLAYGFGDA